MFDVHCSCGETFHAEESQTGKKLRCWRCGAAVLIERSRPAEPESFLTAEVVEARAISSPAGGWKSKLAKVGGLEKAKEVWEGFRLHPRVRRMVLALAVTVAFLAVYVWFGPSDQQGGSSRATRAPNPSQQAAAHDVAGNPNAATLTRPIAPVVPPPPPCAAGKLPERPRTGARIYADEGTSGYCGLKVFNSTDGDAAVRLLWSGTESTARFAYVRSGASYAFTNIEPGTYELRWDTGEGWVKSCLMFLNNNAYSSFDRPLAFTVGWNEEAQEMGCHGHKVTLYEVPGGNISKIEISRTKFLEGMAVSPHAGKLP